MLSESNFIVRSSGRKENSYYIDYAGAYKALDIAKVSGLEPSSVKEIYSSNGGVHDDSQDVYYFGSIDSARKAISKICDRIQNDRKGRLVFLTEAEIEYIRKALINENSNLIHLSNKVKDAIFKKLNG